MKVEIDVFRVHRMTSHIDIPWTLEESQPIIDKALKAGITISFEDATNFDSMVLHLGDVEVTEEIQKLIYELTAMPLVGHLNCNYDCGHYETYKG